jgi:hypothetical protein
MSILDLASTTLISKKEHINGLKPMHFFTEDIVERIDGSSIGVVAVSAALCQPVSN